MNGQRGGEDIPAPAWDIRRQTTDSDHRGRPTRTTIFFACPSEMYFATDSRERSLRLWAGTFSSIGLDMS